MLTKESKRLQSFEVVAYGCHERARKLLLKVLLEKKPPIETFTFVEYFCLCPLVFSLRNAWQNNKLYFPFIRRVIEENQFIWVQEQPGSGSRLQPKTPSITGKYSLHTRFVMSSTNSIEGTIVFKTWLNRPLHSGDQTAKVRKTVLSRHTWGTVKQRIDRLRDPHDKKALLLEFGLLGAPWERTEHHRCRMYSFPIASDTMFYGYFILLLPVRGAPGSDILDNGQTFDDGLADCFDHIAKKVYLPVLTLLHESQFERECEIRVAKALKQLEARIEDFKANRRLSTATYPKTLRNSFGDIHNLLTLNHVPFLHAADTPEDRPRIGRVYNEIEWALNTLWNNRLKLVPTTGIADRDATKLAFKHLTRLREGLLFARYHVASPGIVDAVCRLMGASRRLKPPSDDGKPLSAALVYGNPGSGKDVLARMIPLFSPHYFSDDLRVVNMSALRPDILTGPLLQGLAEEGNTLKFGITGIFTAETNPATKSTFILDELNSLDVDLQGILLRILEQGEVTPLLGLEPQYIKHMIIGVVNEDPEDISREAEIRNLLADKEKFGTLLGGLLYEVVRRSRRLRNDLYHRLRRQLYVKVLDVDDRREDIPILFFAAIADDPRFRQVELRAYRLLMDPSIKWLGNVRQIQSVGSRAVLIAKERQMDGNMSHACVLEALEDEFGYLSGESKRSEQKR